MIAFSRIYKHRVRWIKPWLCISAAALVLAAVACTSSGAPETIPATESSPESSVETGPSCLACELRRQIDSASPGSTINIPAGVYTLVEGELVIDKDVVLVGAGASATIIQAAASLEASSHRVLRVLEGVTTSVSGVTLRYGKEIGTDRQMLPFLSEAAGMPHSGIAEIHAEFGGGIYNQGVLTLTASAILDNAAGGGAGIFNGSKITLIETLVSGNQAGGMGGGVFNGGVLQSTDSKVERNRAGGGAAISNWGNAHISRSTIRANHSRGSGGGIINTGVGRMELDGVTVSDNESKIGGGISNFGHIGLLSSTISGNSASRSGGIDNRASLTAHYTTISQNSAKEAGGLAARPMYGFGLTLVGNSIIAGNLADNGPDCHGAVDSDGHNLVGEGSQCAIAGALNDQLGNREQPIDPGLGPLGPNGGTTHTHLPLAGSPAVDAGGGNPPALDQTGRPRPQGDASDIGAVERPR